MTTIMRAFISILLLICFVTVSAQGTLKSDLVQLNKNYLGLKTFSYTAQYRLYAGNNPAPAESYFTAYKKNGSSYYSKTEDNEFLVNNRYVVFVDHEAKEVLIQPNTSKEPLEASRIVNTSNIATYIDTLLRLYKHTEALPASAANTRAYRFSGDGNRYKQVDLVVDTKQWLVKEITLYFAQQEEINNKLQDVKISISFGNYSLQNAGKDISEEKFLTKSNGAFKLKSTYAKYTLYDKTSS